MSVTVRMCPYLVATFKNDYSCLIEESNDRLDIKKNKAALHLNRTALHRTAFSYLYVTTVLCGTSISVPKFGSS